MCRLLPYHLLKFVEVYDVVISRLGALVDARLFDCSFSSLLSSRIRFSQVDGFILFHDIYDSIVFVLAQADLPRISPHFAEDEYSLGYSSP